MKWGIFITLLLFGTSSYAQKNILYYKKGRKTVSSYFVGSTISFLLKDREWEKGVIKKITSDSIYIQPSLFNYYLMGTDTVTFNTIGFPINDIYAMPRRGYLIDYKNGRFQINGAGGHQHFYWIKSGWLFRWGAAAYLGVAVFNGLTSKNNKVTGEDVAYSAGVFAFGCLLKYTYKPWHKIGKKYHFKVLSY
ncbi:hypothetical protein A3860_38295 [Niastella vici]|uniref:Uncharacterized protein n=1 Tax=Niastella vici TaxID=1703345 RepID=A0A1V9FLL1_9BACT|nr:hypothetical protein [Niastella vici]OQP59234.1 hypothetical protein A3860_38295 [Niastella vici]